MKTVFAFVILGCVAASIAAPATSSSVIGTWNTDCRQKMAYTPSGSTANPTCLTEEFTYKYTITYSNGGNTNSYVADETTKTIGGVQYWLPRETGTSESSTTGDGYFRGNQSGVPACIYVDISGDTYTEYGTYATQTYEPVATCPTSTELANWQTTCVTAGTFNYICTGTKAGSSAAVSVYAAPLVVFFAALVALLL